MNVPRSMLLLLVVAPMVVFVPIVGAVAAPEGGDAPSPEATDDQRREPTADDRELRTQLRALADAWADGGGTFGYPFWEKAGQRWRTKSITTPMYREYVTGYRDRLVVGCDLLEQADVDDDVAGEVRDLVREACERRLDALRSQQRSLDEQIRGASGDPEVDVAASEERVAELDAETTEALQDSYRGTREAMDLAQAELDRAGLERLPEDAFI